MSADNDSAHDAEPVCGNPVVALVVRARGGDERAWAALVERYAPLIWSLCRRYRLDTTDTADVGQNVWLLLVSQLGKIRDPAALPGWLATTTRRECRRVLNKAQVPHAKARAGRREYPGRPCRNDRARAAGSRATRGAPRGVHAPVAP